MAYCQVSDVVAIAPGFGEISNTSKPTAGQVTSMIAEVERETDAALTNLGFVTPIVQATSPIAFAIVKDKVAHAVLAKAIRARTMGTADPKTVGAKDAQDVYDIWLKALRNTEDPTDLPDATTTTDASIKAVSGNTHSFITDLTVDELEDEDDPAITMRQQF